ncbi:MAG TPA: ROK family transcriptional regulator, partial [Microbacterium sp.]|nr:ROK family transcriptional regulator [Microbacterium sp.]
GIVIDGVLRRGATGIAGEVMYLPQPGLPIGAPVLNEVVVADLALTNGRDPAEPLQAHLEAALAGDASAIEMMAELAGRIILVAGSITLVLDPSVFVLAGDAAHPAFVEAIRQAADEVAHLLPLTFVVSSFGREATLLGAVGEATSVLHEKIFSGILTRADRTQR